MSFRLSGMTIFMTLERVLQKAHGVHCGGAPAQQGQMKATGQGYVGGEAYVSACRPRPDDEKDKQSDGGLALESFAFLSFISAGLGVEPDGSADGRQPVRRVALQTLPSDGFRQ